MGASKGDIMLVQEIKSRNLPAFEALVLKYQSRLMSSLMAYTKSKDHAEELCQKTFIRVWQKIDSFRGDSALYTWIYRIGINLAKNEFSSNYSKNAKLTDSIDEDVFEISNFSSPESELIAEESEKQIMNFIKTLESDTKTAFMLREIENKTYNEIAEILNCPIGTVRSRIFRARQLIIEFMDEENILNG
ncbi:MAG: RNA polymerase subunit sigma [Gammaproteobacteria bacterium]|nr:RNA polymerase subunit sigma [Gammaproteobacteria bacterium]